MEGVHSLAGVKDLHITVDQMLLVWKKGSLNAVESYML